MSLFPSRTLDLGDVRLLLFTTLWARSEGGEVVVRPDGGTALEDVLWLGLQGETFPSDRRGHCQHLADELVGKGQAYLCFCTPAELREMYTLQASADRPLRYDGRCRRLSTSDVEALRKAGRSPCVRVILPEGPFSSTDSSGQTTVFESGELDDFRLMLSDGNPSDVFGDVVDDRDAEVDRALLLASRRSELGQRAVIARLLGWTLPPADLLPDWPGLEGRPSTAEGLALSIAGLRTAGFHPTAILRCAAKAGWDPGDALLIRDMAQRFRRADLSAVVPAFEARQLRQENAAVLRAISEDDRVAALVDHLDRRGYPMSERPPEWQRRFTAAVLPDLETFADAEAMAVLLLTPTVDYDRDVARVLREPATQQLVTQFEAAMAGVDSEDIEAWREVLTRFRSSAAAPGRALATLRLVLTGQRNGPNLAALLSLLGTEGCRARVDKARRYG